ncbi:MAG: Na+/H+ antiporter [Acidimicrobiales bacterium]|nr:Na+/H+ antiporter [Acidimicrobiales bacterium]RZV48423.1 MAG: Na+/H+ antiporter [Acidimicrobiales bacterium]
MTTLAAESSSILEQELSVVILLAVAAGIALLVRRIKVPFTVALVVVGLVLAFFPDFIDLDISSELILGILVPPLLFEAVLHLPWPRLKADLGPILMIAIGGTLIGTFLVGYAMRDWVGLPWLAALAFGALISATDPVAVIALFKSLGVNKRLAVLVEGESLFNDAVAVVIFNLALGAAAAGETLTWGHGIEEFFIVGLGGLAVGLTLGYIVSELILEAVDDPLIETSTTLALAYGSYVVAESFGTIFGIEDLHLSGILAVVAAGLMVGNIGLNNTSPSTRVSLESFWELLTFLVNSFIFLLIGIQIDVTDLSTDIPDIAIAIGVVLVIRLMLVYGINWLHGLIQKDRKVPVEYRHVAFWGGLRGAISLALALTLAESPAFTEEVGETIKLMTFGVVLFTLIVQGTTIGTLISRLGLSGKSASEEDQQRHQALIYARRAGRRELERLGHEGVLFREMADAMTQTYDEQIEENTEHLGQHFVSHPELEISMLVAARRDALLAEQSALLDLGRRGLASSEVVHELSVDLDHRVAALELLEERWESDSVFPDVHSREEGPH